MTNLAQRVLTAGVLISALLLLLFAVPTSITAALLGVLTVLGAWEWAAFAGWHGLLARGAYAGLAGLLLAGCQWMAAAGPGPDVVLWVGLAWWAVAFQWVLRYPVPISAAAAAVSGLFVLVPAWLALLSLLGTPGIGSWLTLLALVVIFAADIGGYFAGRRLGRLKLAPRVSPGKTWEGFLGGLGLAALTAGTGGALLGLSPLFMVPLGLGVAALSVVGDLTESMFKRHVGVKDSGSLLPGHGGVLDRLDSVTAGLPLFAIAMRWAELPPQ